MKRLSLLLLALPFAFLLQTCADDESENLKPEKIQFNLALKSDSDDGGRSAGLPSGLSLIISVTKPNGNVILDHHRIRILNISGTYMTEPIELVQGNYKITDFLLVNEDSEILYATPRNGSPLAGAVSTPLPYNFYVVRDKVSNVDIEVIDVQSSPPEAFGYASFDINIVRPLRISVFAPNNGELKLVSAKAYIIDGWDFERADTLQIIQLGAKMNVVPFKPDPDKICSMSIKKEGYVPYTENFFTYNELIERLASQPLTVVLTPILTMTATVTDMDDNGSYNLGVDLHLPFNEIAFLTIDYGDGREADYIRIPDLEGSTTINHNYESPGTYTIQMYGDLNKITEIQILPGQGSLESLDLTRLPSLTGFQMSQQGPTTLDFSSNKNLQWLTFINTNITTIKLPVTKKLEHIAFENCPNISTEAIDGIINSLYSNTKMFTIKYGNADLRMDYTPSGINSFTGPPSATAMDKLREMRDQYNWDVSPSLD